MLNSISLQDATLDFIQQNGYNFPDVSATPLVSPLDSSLQYPNTSDFPHQRQQQQSIVCMNNYHYKVSSNKSLSSPPDDEYDNSCIKGTNPSLHSSDVSLGPSPSLYIPGDYIIPKTCFGSGIAGFVFKLYQCLQNPQVSHTYARWYRHAGKDMFVIDCIPKFTKEVLPTLFKHGKFSSFVRQLNIYGFQRDTDARKSKGAKDKETCRWHHPYFQPGRHDLFPLIRRKATLHCRQKRSQPVQDSLETIIITDSFDDRNRMDNTSGSSIVPMSSSLLPSPSGQHKSHLFQSSALSLTNINRSFDGIYKGTSTLNQVLDKTIPRQPPLSSSSPPPLCRQEVMHASAGYTMGQPVEQPLEHSMEEMTHLGYSDIPTVIATTSTASKNGLTIEQGLQQQLNQLQINFTNDYHFYSKQIRQAYNLIDQQRLNIDRLETISALRQSHMNHRSGIHHDNQRCNRQPTSPFDSVITDNKQAVPANKVTPLLLSTKSDPAKAL